MTAVSSDVRCCSPAAARAASMVDNPRPAVPADIVVSRKARRLICRPRKPRHLISDAMILLLGNGRFITDSAGRKNGGMLDWALVGYKARGINLLDSCLRWDQSQWLLTGGE